MNRADDLKHLPLPQQLLHWARTRPDVVALRQKEFGVWRPVTWASYAQQSRWFGLGLLKLGLEPGQAVAILGENCKEWVYAQFGAGLVRCITAGVYPTSPAEEVEYLLALSEHRSSLPTRSSSTRCSVREPPPQLRASSSSIRVAAPLRPTAASSTRSSPWAAFRGEDPPAAAATLVRRSTTSA
jgi:long-subunit acyl-CoA synthetase (AMP-forming)